jgi:hypothetical protein
MPRKKSPIPADLLIVSKELKEYRSGHRPRSPLPDELWKQAVILAAKHGLHRTARALPIDYAGLKKRVSGRSKPRNSPLAMPAFVELMAAPPSTPNGGVCIELLRIESSGPVDWPQLLGAWRRPGSA